MILNNYQQYRVDTISKIIKNYKIIYECGFYEDTHKEYQKFIQTYDLDWIIFEKDKEIYNKYKNKYNINYGDFLDNLPKSYNSKILQMFRVCNNYKDIFKIEFINDTLIFFDTKHILIKAKK